MTSKPNKKSRIPPPPFPWRCSECGADAVRMSRVAYKAEVRHDGRLHAVDIPRLELPVRESCGAKVFTERVDQQINDALREHLNLLTPQQMREGIARAGVTQKQLSAHLGIAEATLSRWLTETQIQSRSMDTLLRVYFAFPDVRQALSDESRAALV